MLRGIIAVGTMAANVHVCGVARSVTATAEGSSEGTAIAESWALEIIGTAQGGLLPLGRGKPTLCRRSYRLYAFASRSFKLNFCQPCFVPLCGRNFGVYLQCKSQI
jgi:hypothetical protein